MSHDVLDERGELITDPSERAIALAGEVKASLTRCSDDPNGTFCDAEAQAFRARFKALSGPERIACWSHMCSDYPNMEHAIEHGRTVHLLFCNYVLRTLGVPVDEDAAPTGTNQRLEGF